MTNIRVRYCLCVRIDQLLLVLIFVLTLPIDLLVLTHAVIFHSHSAPLFWSKLILITPLVVDYHKIFYCLNLMIRGSQVSSGDASQTVPLQGTCSGCGLTRRLHSDGRLVYRHGPHNKPCPGSGKPPTSIIDHSQSSDISGAAGIRVPGVSSQVCAAIDAASVQGSDPLPHVTCGGPTIKHIPKTARVACVGRLTQLLDEVLDSPGDEGRWLNLLNFGGDILSKPSRGGKRHSLSAQIKKRCSN